jgi:integrase
MRALGKPLKDTGGQVDTAEGTKREPRFLSEDEYRWLLRTCSHNVRDAAIIEVLPQTGMRQSELASLTVADLKLPARITRDPENTSSARVWRKGGKVDTIPCTRKRVTSCTPG